MKSKFKIIVFFICCNVVLFSQTTNKNGYNKFYYDNGAISSEGNMVDGKPEGYWKNYHKNGKIKIEGNRKNFQLDSIWKFYDEKGRLQKTVNYKEGKKNGETRLYDTLQKLTSIETLANDVLEGKKCTYHKNGRTKTFVNYIKGKPEGVGYEYSNDSLITGITTYKGGIIQSYEKINQRDAANKKQGIWKDFYEDLSVKKEQKFNDDSLDGYVKEFDKKGNLLSTKKFNNGKQILKAPEIANVEVYRDVYEDGTLKYEGVYSEGVAIGTHFKYIQKRRCDSSLILVDDTTLIEPVYKNKLICRNVAIPDSCIEYFDGTVVARGAVDSVRNRKGIWTEFHNTGEFKGKGSYKEGNRVGDWEFYYPNGKIEQKGKYDKKGRAQGVWKWFYESGNLYREENYVNGKREGQLKDVDENGKTTMIGNYVDNLQDGKWMLETANYKEQGNYVNGEPDSTWQSFYMPSKIKRFEGKFQNGEPIGVHTYYHPNGKRMVIGSYSGGAKTGDWVFYDNLGFAYLTINYENDIEIKWQGVKIIPTYEQGLRTYNIKIDDNKTQTIRK